MPDLAGSAKFILYHTEGCHLCEIAAQLLREANVSFEFEDICDDETLAETYGIRIPVLKALTTNNELEWPFDSHALKHFMGANIESSSN